MMQLLLVFVIDRSILAPGFENAMQCLHLVRNLIVFLGRLPTQVVK